MTCAALSSKEGRKEKGNVLFILVFFPRVEEIVNNDQDQESWGLDDGCRSRRCLAFFFFFFLLHGFAERDGVLDRVRKRCVCNSAPSRGTASWTRMGREHKQD